MTEQSETGETQAGTVRSITVSGWPLAFAVSVISVSIAAYEIAKLYA